MRKVQVNTSSVTSTPSEAKIFEFLNVRSVALLLFCFQTVLSFCNPNQYFDPTTGCQNCSSRCTTCSSLTVCTECSTGYFLFNNKCSQCPSSCSACATANNCTSCSVGFNLVTSGSCIQSSTSNGQEASNLPYIIVGAVLGTIFGIALIAVCVIYYIRHFRKPKVVPAEGNSMSNPLYENKIQLVTTAGNDKSNIQGVTNDQLPNEARQHKKSSILQSVSSPISDYTFGKVSSNYTPRLTNFAPPSTFAGRGNSQFLNQLATSPRSPTDQAAVEVHTPSIQSQHHMVPNNISQIIEENVEDQPDVHLREKEQKKEDLTPPQIE